MTQRSLFAHAPVLTCQFGTPVGPGCHQTCEGCDRLVKEAHEAMQAEIRDGLRNRRLFTRKTWVACGFQAEDWASCPGFHGAVEEAKAS